MRVLMNEHFSLNAHAKTNLFLRVTGRRDDGFHGIETRMTLVSLHDTLDVRPGRQGRGLELSVEGADWTPGKGERNLVEQAYDVYCGERGCRPDLQVTLVKRIPSGAGLGGGSSDAAAMLRALDRVTGAEEDMAALEEMAAGIGSDVAFFVRGRVSDCSGRGEVLKAIDGEHDWILPVVLLKPGFAVATADAYSRWATSRELPGVAYRPQLCPWGEMVNDLERPVFEKFPLLAEMKSWLLGQPGVHAALLSGSGSAMLAVLSRQEGGEHLAAAARESFGEDLWTFVGHTLCRMP